MKLKKKAQEKWELRKDHLLLGLKTEAGAKFMWPPCFHINWFPTQQITQLISPPKVDVTVPVSLTSSQSQTFPTPNPP